MQLALRSDAFDPELKFVAADAAPAASRANKLMIASIAMLGAGAIAVSPVSPVASLDIQQRAVQLAAAANPVLENPLVVWQNNIAGVFANIDALGATIAEQPHPIVTQIVANQQGYLEVVIGQTAAEAGTRRGNGLKGAAEGIETTKALFEVRIAEAQRYLAQGDITAAWGELESAWLIGFENIGQPLLTLFNPVGDMLQNSADVWDSLFARGNAAALTRALLAPPITASFALANVADVVQNELEAGDYEGALTALVNAPGLVTGAFLNGYKPVLTYDENGDPLTYATETFQGVLTPRVLNPVTGRYSAGGTIDQLFVTLPRAIATALKPTVVPAAVTSTGTSNARAVTVDVVPAEKADIAVTPATEATDDVVAKDAVDTETTKATSDTKKLSSVVSTRKGVKEAREGLASSVKSVRDGVKKALTKKPAASEAKKTEKSDSE